MRVPGDNTEAQLPGAGSGTGEEPESNKGRPSAPLGEADANEFH